MRAKKNKYLYLWIVQGFYGTYWEDVCCSEVWKEARDNLKDHRASEPYAFRMIKRRELNT